MSGRTGDPGRTPDPGRIVEAPFASLVERESGAGTRRSGAATSHLVPRLPAIFEARADGAEGALTEEDVLETSRRAPWDQVPPPAAPSRSDSGAAAGRPVEQEPVRRRLDVVRIERQVLVETGEPATLRARQSDDSASPRSAPPAALGRAARPDDRTPAPWGDVRPEPRRPLRPAGDGSPVRPVATDRAVAAPGRPARRPDAHQRGLPVVATRRDVAGRRPAGDHGPAPRPEPAEPVVRVSIGRLEIRAIPAPAPAPAPARGRPERRTQSLDDYLERRNRGNRP